jgi:YD repeat-containing protein
MIKPKLSAKNSNLWAVSWIFGFPFVLSGDVVDVIWESVGPLLDGEPEYYSGEAIALGDKGELKRAALGHTTEYEYNKPKYNASGQIISQSEKSGGSNYQYFYDAEGRLIKMEENSYGDDVTEFVYNDYGYLVKKMEYEDSSLRHYIIYDYDHRGLLLNEKEYSGNGEFIRSHTYRYTDNGPEISEVVVSYKDGSSYRDKYEYSYNADGTIKNIKVTSSDGSLREYAIGYTANPNETGLR